MTSWTPVVVRAPLFGRTESYSEIAVAAANWCHRFVIPQYLYAVQPLTTEPRR